MRIFFAAVAVLTMACARPLQQQIPFAGDDDGSRRESRQSSVRQGRRTRGRERGAGRAQALIPGVDRPVAAAR